MQKIGMNILQINAEADYSYFYVAARGSQREIDVLTYDFMFNCAEKISMNEKRIFVVVKLNGT